MPRQKFMAHLDHVFVNFPALEFGGNIQYLGGELCQRFQVDSFIGSRLIQPMLEGSQECQFHDRW
jgi:hypothetical protein